MNEGSFSLDGLRFHYLEWGNPSADAIVLLHGFSSNARAWARVGETLAADFHVVALDQRGHGDTDWDPELRYTDAQYAADARAFTQHLGIRPPFTLIGHSMGGAIGYTYAGTYPADLTRLVIEDSAPIPPGRPPMEVRSSFASRAEVEQAVRASVVNMPEEVIQQRVDLYYRAREDGTWGYRADVVGVRKGRAGQDPEALWNNIRNITVPTLMIRAGAEPALVSTETAERLTHENPRIEVVTVPDAGHNIHFAHFDAFMPILRQFLAEPAGVA